MRTATLACILILSCVAFGAQKQLRSTWVKVDTIKTVKVDTIVTFKRDTFDIFTTMNDTAIVVKKDTVKREPKKVK